MNERQGSNDVLHEGVRFPSPFSRIIALGYYDGPTSGILEGGTAGPAYKFVMLDGDDLRIYSLAPLPPGSLENLVQLLTPYQQPRWPLWCPRWSFPSEALRAEVEAETDRILGLAGPVEWVVAAEDLLHEIVAARSLRPGSSVAAAQQKLAEGVKRG